MIRKLINKFYLYRLKYRGARISSKIRFNSAFVSGFESGLSLGDFACIEKDAILSISKNIYGNTGELSIGRWFYLNRYSIIDCHFSIKIGNRVQIGPHCYLCDFDHGRNVDISLQNHRGSDSYKSIVIEDNVWIAAGVVILKGVVIGENSIIGAGAVVTRNIPPNSLAVGVPAKVICTL